MFNKRHYSFIADTIKEHRAEAETAEQTAIINTLVWKFADRFTADNSAFDADRFFNATVEGVPHRAKRSKSI